MATRKTATATEKAEKTAAKKTAAEKTAAKKTAAEKPAKATEKAAAEKAAEKKPAAEKARKELLLKGESRVDPTLMPGFIGYVLRKDGKYLSGVGYGGPGKPVPYWADDLGAASGKAAKEEQVKIWKRLDAARDALEKFGGTLRAVKVRENGQLCRIWGWSEELAEE